MAIFSAREIRQRKKVAPRLKVMEENLHTNQLKNDAFELSGNAVVFFPPLFYYVSHVAWQTVYVCVLLCTFSFACRVHLVAFRDNAR